MSSFQLLLHPLLLLLVVGGVAGGGGGGGRLRAPSLEFHHRFSSPVQRWAEARGHVLPGGWPEHGSADYVAALNGHDRRRALSAAGGDGGGGGDKPPPLTFSEGNATLKVSNLGL